jgi:hypothetical protein
MISVECDKCHKPITKLPCPQILGKDMCPECEMEVISLIAEYFGVSNENL